MPTSVGPNTFGEENLVFGYDLGDTVNSYRGEPTTNLASLDLSNAKWYSEGGTKVLQSETLDGYPVYRFRSSGSLIYVSPVAFNQLTATSNDVTLSAYFRNVGTSAQTVNVFLANDFGTDSNGDPNNRSIPADGKWYRQSWTRYAAANTYNQVEFRTFSDTLLISKPQVEYKKHATPPVEGTRSATQGLIDLKGNSTIDLTNVSFDSNVQMTFDGTNDKVELSEYLTNIDTSVLSLEFVFRTNIGTGTYQPLLGWHYGRVGHGYVCLGNFTGHWGNESISFYNEGTGATPLSFAYTNGHSFLGDTNYHHAVIVLQTGNYQIFVDGEEVTVNASFRNGSQSTVMQSNLFGYGTGPKVGIGVGGQTEGYFNGRIPITKIYNRALTAQEIRSNFNAVKSRFGI